MKKINKLCIILPAYNEAKVIAQVLDKLLKQVKKLSQKFKIAIEIVVIDDGSSDETAKIVKKKKIKLLRHPFNLGLGAVLKTAIEYARIKNFDIFVSFDSDGQHDPKDLAKVIEPVLKNEADIVIGLRSPKKMPWDRRLLTYASTFLTFMLFGIWFGDTQSGFRALNKKALKMINLKTQRMEVSSEFFWEIKKNKLKVKGVPIKVIYTSYSRQKGQSNFNALRVLVKLLLRLFR